MRRKLTENDSSLNTELLANAIYFDDEYLVTLVKTRFDTEDKIVLLKQDILNHMITHMDIERQQGESKINQFIHKHYGKGVS